MCLNSIIFVRFLWQPSAKYYGQGCNFTVLSHLSNIYSHVLYNDCGNNRQLYYTCKNLLLYMCAPALITLVQILLVHRVSDVCSRHGEYTIKEKELISKYFPCTEYKVIQGAGHWVHSSQPDRFLDAVSSFLKPLQ